MFTEHIRHGIFAVHPLIPDAPFAWHRFQNGVGFDRPRLASDLAYWQRDIRKKEPVTGLFLRPADDGLVPCVTHSERSLSRSDAPAQPQSGAGAFKPIPTRYRGHFARSRMEARWMVFFDHLGIQFWYEPAGFSFDGVCYLPDFFLPQVNLYAEVKPATLNPDEMAKAEGLCLHSKRSVLLLVGPPDFKAYDVIFVNPGDPFPTTTNALLDVDFHGRKYYSAEHRLFCSFSESDWTAEKDFSEPYQEAVYASRGARFEAPNGGERS